MWAEAYAEAYKTCTKRVCVRIAGPAIQNGGKWYEVTKMLGLQTFIKLQD